VIFSGFHPCAGDRPHGLAEVELRPGGTAHFTASRRRQHSKLQSSCADAIDRCQLPHEGRRVGHGDRAMVSRARNPVRIAEDLVQVASPTRRVQSFFAVARLHGIAQHLLDMTAEPGRRFRLVAPDRLQHGHDKLPTHVANVQPTQGRKGVGSQRAAPLRRMLGVAPRSLMGVDVLERRTLESRGTGLVGGERAARFALGRHGVNAFGDQVTCLARLLVRLCQRHRRIATQAEVAPAAAHRRPQNPGPATAMVRLVRFTHLQVQARNDANTVTPSLGQSLNFERLERSWTF
jgi:hypothetical protein